MRGVPLLLLLFAVVVGLAMFVAVPADAQAGETAIVCGSACQVVAVVPLRAVLRPVVRVATVPVRLLRNRCSAHCARGGGSCCQSAVQKSEGPVQKSEGPVQKGDCGVVQKGAVVVQVVRAGPLRRLWLRRRCCD